MFRHANGEFQYQHFYSQPWSWKGSKASVEVPEVAIQCQPRVDCFTAEDGFDIILHGGKKGVFLPSV